MDTRECDVEWCHRTDILARSMCSRCYNRWVQGRDPDSIPKRRTSPERKAAIKDEIIHRIRAGESTYRICADLMIERTTLRRWLREWGIDLTLERTAAPVTVRARPAKNARNRWTRDDAMVALDSSLSTAEKAERLGRSATAVNVFVRTYLSRDDDPYGIKGE